MKNDVSFKDGARIAESRKRDSKGKGFQQVQHDVFRKLLPRLAKKYKGQTARDAVIFYLYLFGYVSGDKENEYYCWAYPTTDKIVEDTGLHRNRVSKLTKLLKDENLLLVRYEYKGKPKKFYLPLHFDG